MANNHLAFLLQCSGGSSKGVSATGRGEIIQKKLNQPATQCSAEAAQGKSNDSKAIFNQVSVAAQRWQHWQQLLSCSETATTRKKNLLFKCYLSKTMPCKEDPH